MKSARQPDRSDSTALDFLPDADAIERTPLPRYLRMTVHAMVAVLLAFIVWASVSQIDKVVSAQGSLVNTVPNIVVQPLDTSIVQQVLVRPGQVVKKGQLLATLDPTFTQADEVELRSRLGSLDAQADSLRAELQGKASQQTGKLDSADRILQAQLAGERQANYSAQKMRMAENIERLKASMETNKRDQQVLVQRLRSLSEIEQMQERLMAENFGAKMHLLEARDRRLEVERTLTMGRNRDTELARELAAAQAELLAFDKSWRQKAMEDLLSTTRERDSIVEQLAKANKRHQLVQMTAPADAVVLEVAKLSTGSVARQAEMLFTLVPLDARMEAEVRIDAADMGGIKRGDAVHVKIEAFPYQKHGMMEGTLRTVSEDAFKREQAQPGQISDAYFVARIALDPAKPLRNMAGTRLLPGMTLSAEVVTGKRTVMSYLLWPLTKALDESIREP